MGVGGSSPPPLACEVCKIARFCCFLGRFLVKNWKQHPPKEIGCRSCEVDVVIRYEKVSEFPILGEKSDSISCEDLFFFGDHLFLGRKIVWISDFGREIRLNFGEDLFFFSRPPVFERKKRLNFRAFREIPSQISDKPCETDSRIMKIQVKVLCTFLTLSKKPPSPFSKSWLRACSCVFPFYHGRF